MKNTFLSYAYNEGKKVLIKSCQTRIMGILY